MNSSPTLAPAPLSQPMWSCLGAKPAGKFLLKPMDQPSVDLKKADPALVGKTPSVRVMGGSKI